MINFSINLVSYTQFRRFSSSTLGRAGIIAGLFVSSLAAQDNYLVHNLVSDLPGIADHTDPNLVNPWGVGFSGTSPFWIGNNSTGTSTLYNTAGVAVSLVVTIPAPPSAGANAMGAVTGVLFNSASPSFIITSTTKAASFLFCTEDGTIVGWNSSVPQGNQAQIMLDNSASGAVYKGCALGTIANAPALYAANFNAGTVDVWDGNLKALKTAGGFVNAAIPSGFAPFNIQNIGGTLYVAYAKQDAMQHDDVAGVGNGYLATFDLNGNLLTNLISTGVLNSPWGLAVAPSTFGPFAGALLVGNFGDGFIHAYNLSTGALMGGMADTGNNPISLPGLWALNFGNGGTGGDKATLYFTSGPGGPNGAPLESHGLFGSMQGPPSFLTSGVLNGASFSTMIAPNTFISIKGGALAATTRSWQTADFTGTALPTQLDNVSVSINGQPAFVNFVSPTQINVLTPSTLAPGPAQIQVTNHGLVSASVAATVQTSAPALFTIGAVNAAGNSYIAATHSDGAVAGPPGLLGTTTTMTPFTLGETIVLYGTGFGGTSSPVPNGQIVSTPLTFAQNPVVMIGGEQAIVVFAGQTATGLDQFNVVVPSTLSLTGTGNVDVPVVIQAGGTQTQANAVISVTVPTT
jgi:uncharacterized protein (TIGR03118 family)